MKPNTYYFTYWYPTQSKLFSYPNYYGTENREEFKKMLDAARGFGYEIEYIHDGEQEDQS